MVVWLFPPMSRLQPEYPDDRQRPIYTGAALDLATGEMMVLKSGSYPHRTHPVRQSRCLTSLPMANCYNTDADAYVIRTSRI
jgi:hypothetical protein